MSAAEADIAGDTTVAAHEHWQVTDAPSAEWALRKLAAIRAQQAENRAVYDEERRTLDDWLERRNGTLDQSAQFFEALLTNWHQTVLDADPDRKTISLPKGELRARRQQDRWSFGDDFTSWAKAHRPTLIRTRVEVDKAAAKKALATVGAAVIDADSGEKVPGVTVEPGEVKFTVTVEGGTS